MKLFLSRMCVMLGVLSLFATPSAFAFDFSTWDGLTKEVCDS